MLFNTIKQIFESLNNLVFPPLCISCHEEHHAKENIFCVLCLANLPFTDYHLLDEHELSKRFYGRVELDKALAMFHFYEDSDVQKMLHKIKYQSRPDIAEKLGQAYGEKLKSKNVLTDLELIVPVPLHSKRLRERGYNQSFHFAKGLASALMIRCSTNHLERTRYTETQTKKTIEERRKNVDGAFKLVQKSMGKLKHVMIVDDVITTGTTIEACSLQFVNSDVEKISVCCIAAPKFGL